MINWFGQEELDKVVGGERWWQVRGLDGIDAEWITEKEYLHDDKLPDRELSAEEQMVLRMEKLDTVMVGSSFRLALQLMVTVVLYSWRYVHPF